MTTLVEFPRARLDEDEAVAHAATSGPWWYNPAKQWLDPDAFERYDLAKGEEFVGYGGPHPFTGAVAATGPSSDPQSMADAEHIARHAPARVLAEVDAKRELLMQHSRMETKWRTDACATCAPQPGRSPWPCATLRLLALPYADHPDHREEWKP